MCVKQGRTLIKNQKKVEKWIFSFLDTFLEFYLNKFCGNVNTDI